MGKRPTLAITFGLLLGVLLFTSVPALAQDPFAGLTRTLNSSARTWAAVAFASAVSVLVMDCTAIGWLLPMRTPPTSTVTVLRRMGPTIYPS